MLLKPQDILVLLKLVLAGQSAWSYNRLALDLGMSPSEVHGAVRRALAARLALQHEAHITPNLRNLEEFLVYGLKYVFLPDRGELTRGLPTLHGAPPLKGRFAPSDEPLPVWPDREGDTRGTSFSPIYQSAPGAARRDPKLYELLVLVDAIRAGRVREREFAVSELKKRLREHGGQKTSKS